MNLGVENFSFSPHNFVGSYLRPFHTSTGETKYIYTSGIVMAQRFRTLKDLRQKTVMDKVTRNVTVVDIQINRRPLIRRGCISYKNGQYKFLRF